MSNYWAIAIGINQYQQFQPLLYAQWDAQALWNYWVKEGGIPQSQCLLLTDGVVNDAGTPALPTKDRIEQQLSQIGHQRVGIDDVVWCFFSGYGIQIQGQDYLMPLDGDPQQVQQTGISAHQFFSLLSGFPTNRIVVLLDLKRPPNIPPNGLLGDDMLRQAQIFGLATIMASQPDQSSHETLTLRQGIFTFAVIEGLRTQGCFQLGLLAQYVQSRLPALSQYHWRPQQDAAVVMSSSQAQQQLLPTALVGAVSGVRSPSSRQSQTSPIQPQLPFNHTSAALSAIDSSMIAPSKSTDSSSTSPAVQLPFLGSGVQELGGQELSYSPPGSQPLSNAATIGNGATRGEQESGLGSGLSSPYPQSANPTIQPYPNPPTEPVDPAVAPASPPTSQPSFWLRLLLVILGILAIVVVRNFPSLQGTISSSESPGVEGDRATPAPNSSDASPEVSSSLPIDASPNPNGVVPTGEAKSALEQAQTAKAVGQYDEALQWLDQVPASAQTEEYAKLRAELEEFRNQSGQRNQAILNAAIASLNQDRDATTVSQASDFGRAIAIANRIQPGEPLYDQAQEYIQRWGQVILDLAKARAQSGSYEEAIGAASLIESDLPSLYQQSQVLIQQWQQSIETKTSNQDIIDDAKANIRYGDSLSYSRAIRQLLTIKTEEPQYDDARRLIDTWSREILAIANQQAKSSDFRKAIESAEMIPSEAPVFLEAQEAIKEWGKRLAGD